MFTRLCLRRSIPPAKAAIGKSGAIWRDKFPVEPGRAVAADLSLEIEGREDADGEVPACLRASWTIPAR